MTEMSCHGTKYCPDSCVRRMEGNCTDYPKDLPADGPQVQKLPSPKICPIITRKPGDYCSCQREECQAWEPQFGDCSLLIPGKLAGIEVARTESRA